MISKKYLPILYFILGFGIFMFTRLSKLVPVFGDLLGWLCMSGLLILIGLILLKKNTSK